jgi:2-oxoglutarate ferredoxin oxidoreductase subunit gamma
MRLTEIRIAGFGGQGVILSAVVLGKAASIYENGFATMTQNFGPEARGGACSAQLVISDEPVLYPYVTHPDIMVIMSQEAYNRFAGELKPGGLVIIEEDLVRVSNLNRDKKVYSIPATRFAEELGKRMVLNSVMVGFFTAVTKLLRADGVRKSCGGLSAGSLPRIESEGIRKGIRIRQYHASGDACEGGTGSAGTNGRIGTATFTIRNFTPRSRSHSLLSAIEILNQSGGRRARSWCVAAVNLSCQ